MSVIHLCFFFFFVPDKELSEGVILNGFVDLPGDRSDVVLLILFYSVLSILCSLLHTVLIDMRVVGG